MRKGFIIGVVFLGIISLLSACGGGGGGGGKGGGGGNTSPSTISGLVGSGSGSGSGSVSLKAVEGSGVTNSPISDAIVEILAYDKSGNRTGSATTSTFASGAFTATVELSNSGGYVVINVKKSGYTEYSKRIDFETPSDINLAAELQSVTTSIVSVVNGTFNVSSATGSERKSLKIALFRDPKTGKQSILSGSAIALKKQNGSNPVLEIDIPADPLINAGVSTLKADLKSFVGNSTDASSFPGDFVDSSGNRLVTSGFDYINITTDTGVSLGEAISSAVKAGRITKQQASEPVYLTRFIYKEMCPNLLRDVYCSTPDCSGGVIANTLVGENDGYQVPVYSYRSSQGTWVLLGLGTLDIDGNGIINGVDKAPISDQDGDGDVDHKDYQKYCDTQNGLYMVIEVRNQDFLTNWWNLDYPLLFELPKEICTNVTVSDGSGNPLSGIYLSFWDDDSTQSFNYGWGSTDSLGKSTLKAYLTSNSDTDRSGTLGYWDPINYIYNTTSVTFGDSPNCTPTPITITKPKKCTVKGTIKDDTGAPKSGLYVYILSANPTDYYYNWAWTDSSGAFSMDAKCQIDQNLYAGYDASPKGKFNPNGLTNTTPYTEKTDIDLSTSGNYEVTLNDIVLTNNPPYAYGWLSTTSTYVGNAVTAYIYGWDAECDSPLSWKIKDGSYIINSGTWSDCWGYSEKSLLLGSGTHPLSLEITDSKGKVGTASLGTLYVVTANRPPVIEYAYGSPTAVPKGGTLTLYGKAYDLDGNSLTASFTATSGSVSGCTGTSGTGVVTTTCTYTAPNADEVVTITYSVSDGTDTVSTDFYIVVGDTGDMNIIIQ